MKRYRVALPVFALWLAGWIFLSWPAIQDDALIHLRYADHLREVHFITYDGVRPNFGTSSLLYVGVLSLLSSVARSPELPRLVSSIAHGLLFCGLAWILVFRVARTTRLGEVSSLVLLALLVAPSSIRWLDDGMETGLVLCLTACLATLAFDEARRSSTTRARFAVLLLLGYVLVMLRTELIMLAAIAAAAIVAGRVQRSPERSRRTLTKIALGASHLLIGCGLASVTILLTMGVLLPDTAVAKAEGLQAWRNVLIATAVVMTSSFAVGAGLFVFWLSTLVIVLSRRRTDAATIVANTAFPVLLFLTTIRGQAVQGVRYLLWALLFPTLWNILSFALEERAEPTEASWPRRLIYAVALLLLIELPLESKIMYKVLTTRARTMREFEAQHLDGLAKLRGAAMDIGYIGYFTRSDVCDMSGLVNGRAVARLKPRARAQRCAAEKPDFVFGNLSQLHTFGDFFDISSWRVCSGYDFVNVRTPDTHYLIAAPGTAERICRSTGAEAGSGEALTAVLPGSSWRPGPPSGAPPSGAR